MKIYAASSLLQRNHTEFDVLTTSTLGIVAARREAKRGGGEKKNTGPRDGDKM